jgi:A/G-specific adenine glycosylase
MLQQTQSSTVIPYFLRWMDLYPTVRHLAEADEQDLLATWQGLGYYRRCRLLQAGARYVTANGFPSSATDWRAVPGIGAYTAGAISSIAQNLPEPLVDGNVVRVYSRLAADDAVGPSLERNTWSWAKSHIDRDAPGSWNQALMELGATVCKPKQPLCSQCPLTAECSAFQAGKATDYPKVVPKPPPVQLRHSAIIRCAEDGGDKLYALEQIPTGEWWEGMWRFPRAPDQNLDSVYVGCVAHTVTNHRIRLEVFRIDCAKTDDSFRWLSAEQIDGIALPSPQRKAFNLLRRQNPLPFT